MTSLCWPLENGPGEESGAGQVGGEAGEGALQRDETEEATHRVGGQSPVVPQTAGAGPGGKALLSTD